MSEAKLSHKVPSFLLKNFSSRSNYTDKEYYINCFDKTPKFLFENNIKNIGENYYYEIDLNSIDQEELKQEIVNLELEFEKVESATAI
jgi:hypothetical protein